jgi:hypothetical protein
MSREVDTSEGLDSVSDEDLVYLHQRGQVEDHYMAERGISLTDYSKNAVSLEDTANTGTANTAGLSKEQYERRIAELEDELEDARAELEAKGEAQESDEDEEDDEDEGLVAPYDQDGVGVDDLREELVTRGLPVSGNKAELIQRLLEDDAAKGQDDTEDDEEEG